MPVSQFTVGPFYSMSVNGLVVNNIRTGGCTIREETPSTYMPCLDNSVMTDLHKVSFSLTFYNPNELIINLGRGQVPNTSLNSPPNQSIYSLTLMGLSQSFTFPAIRTQKIVEINYNKDRATQITIAFVSEERNPDTLIITYA